MKFIVDNSSNYQEVEITIKCNMIDPQLQKIIEMVRLYGFSITARKDGEIHVLKLEDIYYFETTDDKTFACCKKEVFECDERLYELEERLLNTSFVRISKAMMLNTIHITYVKPTINGRFEVNLDNGESVLVNRHYLPTFKAKFNL